MDVIATYKITYQNGISQTKNLIEHDNYLNDIKPTEMQIDFLESKKKYKDANYLKAQLKNRYGSFLFANKSPLFYPIITGVLELYNGMIEKIEIERLSIL